MGRRRVMRNVFFDIDTQLDFRHSRGRLYAPGAERIIAAVAQLNRHAGASGIVLISTTDATAGMTPNSGNGTALRCRHAGPTQAQPRDRRKSVVVPNRDGLRTPRTRGRSSWRTDGGRVETLTIAPLLERLGADRLVVYGWWEVWRLARGARFAASRKAGDDCDRCVQALRREAGERALAELRTTGATTATVSEVQRIGA